MITDPIRILVLDRAVDPDPHSLSLLDPDLDGKNWKITTEKCKEIDHSYNFMKNCQAIFFQLQKNYKFGLAGSGSALKKPLDPDPHWKNSWIQISKKWMKLHAYNNEHNFFSGALI